MSVVAARLVARDEDRLVGCELQSGGAAEVVEAVAGRDDD
jgi:hypothetical protein